jgi:WD40 repeat protein
MVWNENDARIHPWHYICCAVTRKTFPMNKVDNREGSTGIMDNVVNKPGTTLVIYHGHSKGSGVLAVTWSPDGSRIASGADDDTVHVWQAI